MALPERHLGLVPKEEMTELETKWELLGDLIAEHVDLDRLLAISKTGAKLTVHPPEIQVPDFSGVRVAYALDAAFHFTIKITWILFAQLEPH